VVRFFFCIKNPIEPFYCSQNGNFWTTTYPFFPLSHPAPWFSSSLFFSLNPLASPGLMAPFAPPFGMLVRLSPGAWAVPPPANDPPPHFNIPCPVWTFGPPYFGTTLDPEVVLVWFFFSFSQILRFSHLLFSFISTLVMARGTAFPLFFAPRIPVPFFSFSSSPATRILVDSTIVWLPRPARVISGPTGGNSYNTAPLSRLSPLRSMAVHGVGSLFPFPFLKRFRHVPPQPSRTPFGKTSLLPLVSFPATSGVFQSPPFFPLTFFFSPLIDLCPWRTQFFPPSPSSSPMASPFKLSPPPLSQNPDIPPFSFQSPLIQKAPSLSTPHTYLGGGLFWGVF